MVSDRSSPFKVNYCFALLCFSAGGRFEKLWGHLLMQMSFEEITTFTGKIWRVHLHPLHPWFHHPCVIRPWNTPHESCEQQLVKQHVGYRTIYHYYTPNDIKCMKQSTAEPTRLLEHLLNNLWMNAWAKVTFLSEYFVQILSRSNFLAKSYRIQIVKRWDFVKKNTLIDTSSFSPRKSQNKYLPISIEQRWSLNQLIFFFFSFLVTWFSSIFDECPDRVIMRITAKPYILLKSSFHWICSKFYKFKHGHDFVLTSDLMKTARGQKHLREVRKGMKELIYWKKCLVKVAQQPQEPLSGFNQIWGTTSG